ncbi:hypothetical protein ACN4EE_18900 [Geminocystis sp. CENA526]|uniref:hypothetical protein n=1 Tax=Geminocystis sp. CENA526 TaxID=1355871 RepID=UPI003D6DC796
MSTLTNNDLRELKDLINSKFEQVDRKFEQINDKIDTKIEQVNEKIDTQIEQVDRKFEQVNDKLNDMRVEIATIKEGLNGVNQRLDDWKPLIGKTTDLSEKIGEFKNWKQIAIVVITGFITSLFWIFRSQI